MKTIALITGLTCAALAQQPAPERDSAEKPSYGLERSSIGANVGGGVWISQGSHPIITGGLDFGLVKYFRLYAEIGEALAYNAQIGSFRGGGGVMFTINKPFAHRPIRPVRRSL